MIKRTLYFGNPAYLSCTEEQLVIKIEEKTKTTPIEDLGVVIIDNPQITISHHAIHKLLENNCALITCNDKHMPTGLMLNLDGNTLQQERFEAQINAKQPLLKKLWKQTIESKISNQATILKRQNIETGNMIEWAKNVKSGDAENHESRAAVYYWKNIFKQFPNFTRERAGLPPNNLLNYGYAILRAVTARSLVGSGLLPTLGIHHSNKYNAYCLADDIMEPYRPFVDEIVLDIIKNFKNIDEITTELKAIILKLPVVDVLLQGEKSPLMIAMQHTTASLARCFLEETKEILYPEFVKFKDISK